MPSDREAFLKRVDSRESAAFKEFDDYLTRMVDKSISKYIQIPAPRDL